MAKQNENRCRGNESDETPGYEQIPSNQTSVTKFRWRHPTEGRGARDRSGGLRERP